MRQEIYEDEYELSDWDLRHRSRCFVHLTNSLVWRSITGEEPPTTPPTATEYERQGIPWYDYYAENRAAVDGSDRLAGVESVAKQGGRKGDVPLPNNESVEPGRVVKLRRSLRKGQVREGVF